jgi:hypothetical protein
MSPSLCPSLHESCHLHRLSILCPTEVLGLIMSSLCKINALLEGSQCGGWGKCKGRKGSWLQARDIRGWGIHRHEQGIAFPSKIFSSANTLPLDLGIRRHEQGIAFPSKIFSSANTLPLDFYMCSQDNKEFSVQVQSKPRIRIRYMCLFLVHRSSW